MTDNKLVNLTFFLTAVFISSIFISIFQNSPVQMTPFEFGVSIGESMRHLLVMAGRLALIVFVIRKFRKAIV